MTRPESATADVVESHKRTLWAWLAGTFFGVGLVGKGGGTVASVITLLLWWALAKSGISLTALGIVTGCFALFTTLLGIPAGTIVANELRKKDPSEVVLDEVAGQAIALIAVPVNWKYAICSLILFRAFDILKPPPVRQLESLPGGTGIMMDDVAAGILALALVHLALWYHLLG
jgi:phosphatidylglycerophosphatase A